MQVMAANAAAKLLRKMSPAIAAAALTIRASAAATCGKVAAPDTRSVAVGTSPTLEAGRLQAMTDSVIQAAVQAAATAAAEQAGSALQRKCEVLQAALSEQLSAAAQHHRQAHQQLCEDVMGGIKALQEAQGQQLGQLCELAQQQGRAHESLQQGLSQVLTALKAQAQTKQRPALVQSPRPDIVTHGEDKLQAAACNCCSNCAQRAYDWEAIQSLLLSDCINSPEVVASQQQAVRTEAGCTHHNAAT